MPKGFSLEMASPVLRKHSVVALAYQGAVNCGLDQNDPSMQNLLMLYYHLLMAHENRARALDAMFAAFEQAGIPYMPVKGCNLKKLYPKLEFCSMGDVDVLIRLEDYSAICKIMEEQGFSLIADTAHVYEWKRPELMVELHKSLVYKGEWDYFSYYGTESHLAQTGDGTRHDMSLEDSYIYILVYPAKHYRGSGIGCWYVVDLYVFRAACPGLDMDYISQELEKLHLYRFHENMMRTLDVWFRDREADPVTELITNHVFSGGRWGNWKNKNLSKAVSESKQAGKMCNSRMRAWIRTIFPTYETMAYNYRILRKFPVLMPMFWINRWFGNLFYRRKRIRGKIHDLNQVNDNAVAAYKKALQEVGLEFRFE